MQKIWINKHIGILILFIFSVIYQTTVMATEEPIVPDWLLKAPHTPVFKVRDTVNKYGRYSKVTKTITLEDLIKFHGHFCGGLVESAVTLRVAFNELFPDGLVDRTDLEIVSNNSACGGDVAAYLTGARARFGSHLIDPTLTESEFVIRQISTKKVVRVRVNKAVYPTEVRQQMKKIESGQFEPTDIDRFQTLQWDYARLLVNRAWQETAQLLDATDYSWVDPPCKAMGTRKDNLYKNTPEIQHEP